MGFFSKKKQISKSYRKFPKEEEVQEFNYRLLFHRNCETDQKCKSPNKMKILQGTFRDSKKKKKGKRDFSFSFFFFSTVTCDCRFREWRRKGGRFSGKLGECERHVMRCDCSFEDFDFRSKLFGWAEKGRKFITYFLICVWFWKKRFSEL